MTNSIKYLSELWDKSLSKSAKRNILKNSGRDPMLATRTFKFLPFAVKQDIRATHQRSQMSNTPQLMRGAA